MTLKSRRKDLINGSERKAEIQMCSFKSTTVCLTSEERTWRGDSGFLEFP